MIRAYINAITKAYVRAVLPGFATMVMKWIRDLFARVTTDTGTTGDTSAGAKIYRFLENDGLYDDTKILICPEVALKTRGTVPLYVTKSYDLSPNNNDAVQTTETNQPFLAGNIAPNERLGLSSTQNALIFIDHPEISFTASEAWSCTINLDSFQKGLLSYIAGKSGVNGIRIRIDGKIELVDNNVGVFPTNAGLFKFGKTGTITIVYDTSHIHIYFNGIYSIAISSTTSAMSFTSILRGRSTWDGFTNCKLNYYRIQSGAMTQSQVEAEHAMLRSIYPEIESVQIGTQTWATSNLEMAATPMGNPINEMQLGAATEKITNGGFDDATGWTLTSNFTVADGVLKAINTGVTDTATHGTALLSGTWYKVVYTVLNYSSGGVTVSVGGANGTQRTANGTYTEYIKATSTSATKFTSGATTSLQIDNVSVKQIGWADSTGLYSGLIAQGYTAANALKEVAWWCHYNNDPVNGATYGKLYNWYAVKLLQTDIDTYNAANPTNPWGWKVATDAEWETLRTTVASLGWNYDGSTDLGTATNNKQGKALASDSFWSASAVEGAVGKTDYPDKRNISGFTALPGGTRDSNGVFSYIGNLGYWWTSTEFNSYRRYLYYNFTYVYRDPSGKDFGYSVRLIKS